MSSCTRPCSAIGHAFWGAVCGSSRSNGGRRLRPTMLSFELPVSTTEPFRWPLLVSAYERPLSLSRGFRSIPCASQVSASRKSGDSYFWSDRSLESFTVDDFEEERLDLIGWKVLLMDTREEVGVVDEIIHIAHSESNEIVESVLKVVIASAPQQEEFLHGVLEAEDTEDQDYLEFLVPLVEDIVREADFDKKCLLITPPEGLLELARIPQLLRDLQPQLLEFCQQQIDGIKGCLSVARASENRRFSDDARQVMACSGVFEKDSLSAFMPTRRQLMTAGRHDLVEDIMAAGGFLSVAQALKLPSRRRPNGFWEDLRNLDAEIEWFVSGSWTKEVDPASGETAYINQATDEVSTEEPLLGSVSNPAPISQDSFDVGTAVMPRQRKVIQAGRYDLHHAILAHGGYKSVAEELGRQPVSKESMGRFVEELKAFMEEKSMSHIPSSKRLMEYGRTDLACLLRRLGGVNAMADVMEIRPKRYGKGQWSNLEDAAAAVRAYICNSLILERGLSESSMDRDHLENKVWNEALRRGTLKVPTQSSFLKNGRSDLRYLLQKFGRKELSEHLGVVYDVIPPGRRSMQNLWESNYGF